MAPRRGTRRRVIGSKRTNRVNDQLPFEDLTFAWLDRLTVPSTNDQSDTCKRQFAHRIGQSCPKTTSIRRNEKVVPTLWFMVNFWFSRFPHEHGTDIIRFRPFLNMIINLINLCFDRIQFCDDSFESGSSKIRLQGFDKCIFIILLYIWNERVSWGEGGEGEGRGGRTMRNPNCLIWCLRQETGRVLPVKKVS